jgi:FAD/FMN-containing dehydrogenase
MAAGHTGFIDASPDYAEILERLQEPVGQMRVVQLRTLGGAMATVPDDATAFAHRSRKVMVNVGALYAGEDEQPAARDWVARMAEMLHGDDTTGYVNFLGDEGPDRVRQAYPGDTWNRLREIKRRYDPANVFRMNQNIPPAES